MAPAETTMAYRISGGLHRVFDGEGARRYGGRWNSPGQAVIYAGLSYAISMLERLIHLNDLTPPPTDRWVRLRSRVFTEALDELRVELDRIDPEGWVGDGEDDRGGYDRSRIGRVVRPSSTG